MDFAYPAHLKRELDGRYTVTFPDLPDAITQGEDRDDALAMAAGCLAETIGARIVDRAEIPAPSPLESGQVLVAVPVHVAVKGALYVAMQEEGAEGLRRGSPPLRRERVASARCEGQGRAAEVSRD